MAAADKMFHIGTCYTIALSFGLLCSPAVGAGVAVLAGIGKEAFDKLRGGNFDLHDLAADAAGVALAMAVLCVD